MVMSVRSLNLTTLSFLDRLKPPKKFTSTSCTYFRQQLTTALFESAEGEAKVCGRTVYRTRDLRLSSQTPDAPPTALRGPARCLETPPSFFFSFFFTFFLTNRDNF